jgi:hypothetical protein
VDEDTYNRTEQVYASDVIRQVTGRDDTAIDPSRQLAAPVQTNGALAGPQPGRMAPPLERTVGKDPALALPYGQQGQQTAQQVLQEPAKPPAKPKKPKAVEAPAPTAEDGLAIPGFLRRTAGPATNPNLGSEDKPAASSFGMVSNAPAPSNDVNEALQKAFALPGI